MASATQPAAPAPGKGKGKKTKGQKLDIDDFVDTNNFKMIDSSWADIMEDEDVIAPSAYGHQNVSLPSAPKSALGPEIDFNAIPTTGPFRAQVANLQYEVNEEQLSDLFKGLSVVHLRLNTENGRAIGTAAVEFGTKNDLIEALNMNNKQLNGRSVRIFLPNQDRYGDGGSRRGGSRGSYIDNTPMNWRSADRGAPRVDADASGIPPKVFPPPSTGYGADRGYGSRGSGYGGGDGYRPPRSNEGGFGGYGGGRRDFGDDRRRDDDGGRRDRYGDEGRSGGNWSRGPRPGAEGGESEGDGGNWRSGTRAEPPPQRDREGGFGRRDNGRYGAPRDQDPSMPPSGRDSYGPRGGGDFRRREDDGYGRERDFDRAPRPVPQGDGEPYDGPVRRTSGGDDYEPPRSFAPAPREPREPRERTTSGRSIPDADLPVGALKLADEPRRSRPPELRPERLANLLGGTEEETEKPASYSSIFGNAKPVDTLKREMEIEKRLEAEKAAAAEKEAAAKEAAAAASDGGSATGTSPAGSQVGESTRPPRDRLPRGDGAPPRMRRENGDGPRGERRDNRDGDRRGPRGGFDDRNGAFGERRRDGERRPRMGEGGAGNRMDRGRRDGPRGGGDAYGNFGGGERRGPREYGGDRRGGDGPRYNDGGPSERYYRGGGGAAGSGGRDYDNRDYGRDRYVSESDEVKPEGGAKSYVTSNKYDYLNNAEVEHTSD